MIKTHITEYKGYTIHIDFTLSESRGLKECKVIAPNDQPCLANLGYYGRSTDYVISEARKFIDDISFEEKVNKLKLVIANGYVKNNETIEFELGERRFLVEDKQKPKTLSFLVACTILSSTALAGLVFGLSVLLSKGILY